jgi:hypothetical protein
VLRHEDETITIQQLLNDIPGWNKKQILQSMANLLNPNYTTGDPFDGRLKKIQSGVWKMASKTTPTKEELRLEQLQVTIIKEVDNELIVVDDYANIYRMVKVA